MVALAFAIPIVGRLTHWIWNIFLTGVWGLIGLLGILLELLLNVLGIQLEKKLRICIVILRDENNNQIIESSKVIPHIKRAIDIFKEANIKIICSGVSCHCLPLAKNNQVDTNWVLTNPDSSITAVLNPHCNIKGLVKDLCLVGSVYQIYTILRCFYGNWRRVTGYGSPIVIFVVNNVVGAGGCSFGPLTDYVVVETKQIECIAHELGHALNLLFHASESNVDNLMNKSCIKGKHIKELTPCQKVFLRISRHVTYF
jgi:hypothetical protein